MKKTHPTSSKLAAAAALLVLAGNAPAQSSVTLSGVVDLAVRQTRNSLGSIRSLASGSNSTSRLVFSGSEDLGDGMRAGFWLESSIAADTGTPGTGTQFFDRRSTVSLSGRFGELRLGRDWTPVYLGFVFGDPFINVGVGSGSNFLNASVATTYQRAFGSALSPTTLSRSSNAVEYWLPPNLGGVYGQAMYAFSENANAAGSFRYSGGRLGYKSGPFDAAVYSGATRIDATAKDLRQTGVFGSYAFGVTSVMASLTHSSYFGSKQQHLMSGVRMSLGQWVLKVSYNHLDQKGVNAANASIDANDASQLALGVEYLLSKRSAVYGNVARLSNKGVAAFSIPGGAAPAAPGSRSNGVEFGLRHFF